MRPRRSTNTDSSVTWCGCFEDPGDGATPRRRTPGANWPADCGTPRPPPARTPSPGPVHLNAAFVEPLVADALALPDLVTPTPTRRERSVDSRRTRRPPGAVRRRSRRVGPDGGGLPLAELGRRRRRHGARHHCVLRRAVTRRASSPKVVTPDVVVRLGGLPASRILQERLRAWRVRTIGFDGAGFVSDPDRLVSDDLRGLPDPLREPKADGEYVRLWNEASTHVGEWLANVTTTTNSHEISLARCVVERQCATRACPWSSDPRCPIRDVEWWTPPRTVPTYANRGVNGIDGVVSTALGVAAGVARHRTGRRHHDAARRLGAGGRVGRRGRDLRAGRGGQSRRRHLLLPRPARGLDDARFEQLFATPRAHDLVADRARPSVTGAARDDPLSNCAARSRRPWTAAD